MEKRIEFIDNSRSIALFLVVFTHLYAVDSNTRLYVYAFHMPFFFLISGMLHKEAEFGSLLEKMSKRMLIPFLFFLSCGYFFFVISSHSLSTNIISQSIKGIVFGKSIKANDILWFLLVLFNVRIIGNSIIKDPLLSLPFFLFAYIVTSWFHFNHFYLGTTLMALPFYLIGNYLKGYIYLFVQWRFSPIIACFFILLSVVISNINGRVSMAGFVYGHATNPLLSIIFFYINGLLGSFFFNEHGKDLW